MIILLVSITLIIASVFLLKGYVFDNEKADKNTLEGTQFLSAVERAELTVKVENKITNLKGLDHIVKVSYAFLMNNEESRAEMDELTAEVNGVIVETLSMTTAEQLHDLDSQSKINQSMIKEINEILNKGKVIEARITDLLITEQ